MRLLGAVSVERGAVKETTTELVVDRGGISEERHELEVSVADADEIVEFANTYLQ